MIRYAFPDNWIKYDPADVQQALIEAKSTILALQEVPVQKDWVDSLQRIELKREVAGTSRIEGADFTDKELEEALQDESTNTLTRSQRQARAAVATYRWIATIPDDRPIDADLIKEIHRRIVTGADDDHCNPGGLRQQDQNVTFGQPPHRGVTGGEECKRAFESFVKALQHDFPGQDPLVQALAAHYHLAAMHPFLDGNGRTARALGALMKQRAGLRDTCFIAMSNYYYEEKRAYLSALAQAREQDHNLTPFLRFGLRGIHLQTRGLLNAIREELSKAVYRNTMYDLFNRLVTPKRRLIAKRQLSILSLLLHEGPSTVLNVFEASKGAYAGLKSPMKAFGRDLSNLADLGAITFLVRQEGRPSELSVDLSWPARITAPEFLKHIQSMPRAKNSPIDFG